jgi:hypothetical protein
VAMKLSKCGRYWLPADEMPFPDKESARKELHSQIEDYLARGGSIERLSHTNFAETPRSGEEYRDMFKANLSFGHKRNRKIQFNHKLKSE